MNKHFHHLAAVLMGLSFASGGGLRLTAANPSSGAMTAAPQVTAVPDGDITGVTLDKSAMSLTVGGATGSLAATIAPDDAANTGLTWTVTPTTGVVALSGTGASVTVTAVAAGAATIRVASEADDTKYAECVVTVTAPAKVKAVTLGRGFKNSLAIKADGSLWSWGFWHKTPTRVDDESDWAAVSAGNDHMLAIKSGGGLWAWGANKYGQLGSGDTKERTSPTRVGEASDWAAVSAGGEHSLAVKTDGSLWAWGSNKYGQLGSGDTKERKAPTRVGEANDWAVVSACQEHSLALKTDGSLWAWGLNKNYQLGMGDKKERKAPTRVGADSDWAAVSAGGSHSLAVKRDGSLWAWGFNSIGQLGLGDTNDRNVPTRVGDANDWKAVSAGQYHTLAIKTNGSLWAWGSNDNGELGIKRNAGDIAITMLVGGGAGCKAPERVDTANDWAAVSSTTFMSLAVKADGSLWAWGLKDAVGVGISFMRSGVDRRPVQIGTGFRVPTN